jgi:hypothetical protein
MHIFSIVPDKIYVFVFRWYPLSVEQSYIYELWKAYIYTSSNIVVIVNIDFGHAWLWQNRKEHAISFFNHVIKLSRDSPNVDREV